jgi:hypothetical protein
MGRAKKDNEEIIEELKTSNKKVKESKEEQVGNTQDPPTSLQQTKNSLFLSFTSLSHNRHHSLSLSLSLSLSIFFLFAPSNIYMNY